MESYTTSVNHYNFASEKIMQHQSITSFTLQKIMYKISFTKDPWVSYMINHEFHETYHSVTFIVMINSHQR